MTWDVRVADEYVDESFAAEHVERLFGSFARAAGLRLHVAAPGVLPAADMMEDAARAVVRQAYALGSTDNMTAVVVHLAAGAVSVAE